MSPWTRSIDGRGSTVTSPNQPPIQGSGRKNCGATPPRRPDPASQRVLSLDGMFGLDFESAAAYQDDCEWRKARMRDGRFASSSGESLTAQVTMAYNVPFDLRFVPPGFASVNFGCQRLLVGRPPARAGRLHRGSSALCGDGCEVL